MINFPVTHRPLGRAVSISTPFPCGNGAGSFTKNREIKSWACANRILNGRTECDSHHIREDVLESTYTAAIQQMTDNAEEVMTAIREGAMLAMEPENQEKLEQIEREIVATQEEVLALHKQKVDHQLREDTYAAAVERCSKRMQELEAQQAELQTAATRYAELRAWLETFEHCMSTDATSIDGLVIKALVEAIIVWDDHIEVHFKCGATVEQKYVR